MFGFSMRIALVSLKILVQSREADWIDLSLNACRSWCSPVKPDWIDLSLNCDLGAICKFLVYF